MYKYLNTIEQTQQAIEQIQLAIKQIQLALEQMQLERPTGTRYKQ